MEHRHEGTERRISPVVERSNQLLRRPPHEATDSAPGPVTRRPAGRTPPPRQDPPLAAFGEEARRDAAAHGAAAASDSMRRRGERAHAPISATINPAPIHACRSSAAGRCAHASKAGRGCCVACIEASKPRRTPRVRSMPCPSIGLGRLAASHCYCYGHSTSRDAGVGFHPPTTVMRPSNPNSIRTRQSRSAYMYIGTCVSRGGRSLAFKQQQQAAVPAVLDAPCRGDRARALARKLWEL